MSKNFPPPQPTRRSPDRAAVDFAIVQSDPDAVYFRDLAGTCIMANPRCGEVLGVEPCALIGGPAGRFFPREAACAVVRQEEAVLADGIERGCELPLGDGADYWIGHNVARDEAGAVAGVIGRLRDISWKKRLEREIVETSEREMRRIACDLHDELCQDLAAASLIAKLLQKRLADGDEPQAKVAAHIAEMTRRMAVKTREIVYSLAPASLLGDDFVAGLRNAATHLCEAFPVKCGIAGRWPGALCDEAVAVQLYRIAHEAMHNAARHSGGDCVTVRLRSTGGLFALSVSDNGHGISSKGTGLGIASMHYRAGLIGGELTIQSTPRDGTCVTCKVPLPAS